MIDIEQKLKFLNDKYECVHIRHSSNSNVYFDVWGQTNHGSLNEYTKFFTYLSDQNTLIIDNAMCSFIQNESNQIVLNDIDYSRAMVLSSSDWEEGTVLRLPHQDGGVTVLDFFN